MSLLVAALVLAQPKDLRSEFARIAHTIDGQVGAAAVIIEGGSIISYNGDKRFPTQSVYKVPISMAVLSLVEKGKLSLDKKVSFTKADLVGTVYSPIRDRYPSGASLTVRELIRSAVVESDGTASDLLMRLAGGAKAVTAYLRRIGIQDFTVAATEREQLRGTMVQYSNWATPDGAAMLFRQAVIGVSLKIENRILILKDMIDCVTGPNRIKGLLPAGISVAHKTGTSATVHGLTRATNDVGVIYLPDGRHVVVAVFIRDSHADDKARDLVIAKIARAAYDHFR